LTVCGPSRQHEPMRSTERDAATGAPPGESPVSMLARANAILDAFTPSDRSLGISELARRTGIPKASVSRIVGELVEHRMLERRDGELRLGIRLFELGEQATRPSDLRRLALAHMADLRAATGQTVHLAVLEGAEVVYVQILRAKDAPKLPSRVGGRVPAYATGVGKALLSLLGSAELDAAMPPVLRPVGPKTITTREELEAELSEVRRVGIAYEREESAPGVGCAAAPILDGDKRAIAAVSVSIRLTHGDLTSLGPAVFTVAAALSRLAGRHGIRA
jgi:IclR family acetate operon transcriptional repressor